MISNLSFITTNPELSGCKLCRHWQHPLVPPVITKARFLSLAQIKLRLCSDNHRPGYWSNLPCDWPSTAWAYSEQKTENRPKSASWQQRSWEKKTPLTEHRLIAASLQLDTFGSRFDEEVTYKFSTRGIAGFGLNIGRHLGNLQGKSESSGEGVAVTYNKRPWNLVLQKEDCWKGRMKTSMYFVMPDSMEAWINIA